MDLRLIASVQVDGMRQGYSSALQGSLLPAPADGDQGGLRAAQAMNSMRRISFLSTPAFCRGMMHLPHRRMQLQEIVLIVAFSYGVYTA